MGINVLMCLFCMSNLNYSVLIVVLALFSDSKEQRVLNEVQFLYKNVVVKWFNINSTRLSHILYQLYCISNGLN